MRAYILSIGSELIAGNITDTNATFLAQDLITHGIELLHVVQIGDDRPRLVATLRRALADADLVICTGGIGPTDDDLTREAIAEVVGETPAVDAALLQTIQAFFQSRGAVMPAGNAKQAWLIPAAEVLPNPVGTAPGWFVRHAGKFIVTMPGVPREMFRMWREQAVPRLTAHLPQRAIEFTTLKTIGIGESAVAQQLDDLIKALHPIVATYAKDDGVHVRVTVSAETAAAARALLIPTVAEVRQRLGNHIYDEAGRSLPAALLAEMRDAGLTIGIVEVGTGGRFGSLLLSEPDAAGIVLGLAAEPGSPTLPEAASVATRAHTEFGAGLGLGVVATVAPTESGQYEGAIAVALTGAMTHAETFTLRAAFGEIQRRAALHAADVLHRALRGAPVPAA